MRVQKAEQEDELSDELIEARREAAALRSQNAALSQMLDARGVWAASLQESRNLIEDELEEARREKDAAKQLVERLEERCGAMTEFPIRSSLCGLAEMQRGLFVQSFSSPLRKAGLDFGHPSKGWRRHWF
jgi:hypothetical protein